MRGLLLGMAFIGSLPFIFIKRPFFGILVWYWVSLMNPQKLVWDSFFASLPYALITAIATLLAWASTPGEPRLPPRTKTTLLLLALMIWMSVTSLLGTGRPDQIYERWQLVEKMLFMTTVAYLLTTTRARLDQLILVCVLSIAFFGLRGGVFAIMTGGAFRVYGPEGSMIGDNNDLGVALTMTLPLLFYLRERYPQPRLKWPMLMLIGLTVLGDIFTYSRGALVAMVAMGSVLWWRSRKKVGMLMLLAIAVVGVVAIAPPAWVNRMATIETYQKDQSAESRLYLWQLAWKMALKRPLTGAGFLWSFDPPSANRQLWDSGLPPLTRPRAPHSIWFEMLGEQGFPGLALFIGIIAATFTDASWLIRRSKGEPNLLWANNLGRMVQVALVGYCAGGTFVTLATYDGFYALVIIAAAARRVVAAELASPEVGVGTELSIARPAAVGFAPGPVR